MIYSNFPNASLNGGRDARMDESARLVYSERIGSHMVEIWAATIWGHRGLAKAARRALSFWVANGGQDRMVTSREYPGYFLIEQVQ